MIKGLFPELSYKAHSSTTDFYSLHLFNPDPALILLKILGLFKDLLVHFIPVHRGIAVFCQEDDQISLNSVL